MAKLLDGYVAGRPFFSWHLMDYMKHFQAEMTCYWCDAGPKYREALKRLGAGVPGVDCVIGAIDPSGSPFFVNISDANEFRFEVTEGGYRFLTSAMGDYQKLIDAEMRVFLDDREHEVNALASLIYFLAGREKYISPHSNLLAVSRNEIRIFQSRFFRPWLYSYRLTV
jgi:hypothetical protein